MLKTALSLESLISDRLKVGDDRNGDSISGDGIGGDDIGDDNVELVKESKKSKS